MQSEEGYRCDEWFEGKKKDEDEDEDGNEEKEKEGERSLGKRSMLFKRSVADHEMVAKSNRDKTTPNCPKSDISKYSPWSTLFARAFYFLGRYGQEWDEREEEEGMEAEA